MKPQAEEIKTDEKENLKESNLKMPEPETKQFKASSSMEEIDFDVLPVEKLKSLAQHWTVKLDDSDFAAKLDEEDPLRIYRSKFLIAKKGDLPNVNKELLGAQLDEDCIYLCGQSLGLQPKEARTNVNKVLDNWARYTVHTHMEGYLPAAFCDLPPKRSMAKLAGCSENEVAIMNGLSVNLQILFSTFYRPTASRYKILIEDQAFSSDMYVVQSQIRLHNLEPDDALITILPEEGEHLIREEALMKLIDDHKDSLAIILLPGLQYLTGQWFDVKRLTKHAHQYGILVGVDCAHAIGNKELELKEWDVDFAAWCSYKYLCSSAGGIGCIYVNERFTNNRSDQVPMLRAWWGNNTETKFQMSKVFDPCVGADAFKLSNPPPLLVATLMAGLDVSGLVVTSYKLAIFMSAKMSNLVKKQYLITGYLEYLLQKHLGKDENQNPLIEIITPKNPNQRGSQLSVIFSVSLETVQKELDERGIVCDIRMPNVMRITPCPLYTRYADVYNFVSTLKTILRG